MAKRRDRNVVDSEWGVEAPAKKKPTAPVARNDGKPLRIIAGNLKGRRLAPPMNNAIRPTSERTREAVFNLLMHGQFGGEQIIGKHVVDLCCGTGALGLEALSRGAERITFIDQDKHAVALAKQNAQHCNVMPHCHFIQSDATRLPAAAMPADLVLMDAPYSEPLTQPAYEALRRGNWFAQDALFVVEHTRDHPAPELDGATLLMTREYGKALISIYQL